MTQLQKHPVERLFEWAETRPDQIWLNQPQPNAPVLRISWKDAAERVGRLAAALRARNWPAGSSIAVCGINTAHWFLTDLAIQLAGHVPLGLYPKQSNAMTRYILEHSEARALFVGPMPEAEDFMKGVPESLPTIRFPYAGTPPCTMEFDDFCSGFAPVSDYRRPGPDEVMALIYTSGTTGDPKGVMLTYGNLEFVSEHLLGDIFAPGPNERLFSYLPLAHLLERAQGLTGSLYYCAQVFFLESLDREKVLTTLREAAPTRFVAIPLIWTRFHSNLAARIPEHRLKFLTSLPIVGRWVRHKMLSLLGLQNVRTACSGGAPLPKATIEFFRDVFAIEILEAYGQTENSAYCALGLPGQSRPGTVGKPMPNANFRLSAEGEIQVKHAGVMKGYFKDPERTREAFTDDGWLKTGDLGHLDADGFLLITGRIKDIFKTLKGKYISPVPIENALARNTDIELMCLVGANLTQPVVLVVPTPDALKKPRSELERGLLETLRQVNLTLEDHELIAKLLLVRDPWTIENGMLTPTMKVKRQLIEKRYGDWIAEAARDRQQVLVWQAATEPAPAGSADAPLAAA